MDADYELTMSNPDIRNYTMLHPKLQAVVRRMLYITGVNWADGYEVRMVVREAIFLRELKGYKIYEIPCPPAPLKARNIDWDR